MRVEKFNKFIEKYDTKFNSVNNVWFLVAIIAILLRLISTLPGYNYDIESWLIVGKSVANGGIVYVDTFRYTTGPVWCYVLGAIYKLHDILGFDSLTSYHLLITFFLSLMDLATAYLLSKYSKPVYGLIVLLNPASILISGYHTQFESFAIFFAFASWLITINDNSSAKRHIIAALLIGLSLSTKHILVFYPVWLFFAYKKINLKERLYYITIPYLFFFISFLPFFLNDIAREGVINHVFKYSSDLGNSAFGLILQLLPKFIMNDILGWIPVFSGMKFFFMVTMLITGFYVANKKYNLLFPFYLISMIVFTPALADQYFVIPIIAVAMFFRHYEMRWYLIFLSAYLLFISPTNIGSVLVPGIINSVNSLFSSIGLEYQNLGNESIKLLSADMVPVPDSLSLVPNHYNSSQAVSTIKDFVKSIFIIFKPIIQIWLILFYIKYIIGSKELKF